MKNILIIIQYILFGLLMPFMDEIGDIMFSVKAFWKSHYKIGCLILSPIVANILFIVYAWKRTHFDSKREKRFTWILAILNIWPQYQVFKLIRSIINGEPQRDLKRKMKKLDTKVLSVEPWIEAIPQYISTVCIFVQCGYIVHRRSQKHSSLSEQWPFKNYFESLLPGIFLGQTYLCHVLPHKHINGRNFECTTYRWNEPIWGFWNLEFFVIFGIV